MAIPTNLFSKCRQQLGLLDSEMKNKDSWPQGFLEKLRSDESKMIAELDIAKQKLYSSLLKFGKSIADSTLGPTDRVNLKASSWLYSQPLLCLRLQVKKLQYQLRRG